MCCDARSLFVSTMFSFCSMCPAYMSFQKKKRHVVRVVTPGKLIEPRAWVGTTAMTCFLTRLSLVRSLRIREIVKVAQEKVSDDVEL